MVTVTKAQINKLLSVFLTLPRSSWGISKGYIKTENVVGKLFSSGDVQNHLWICADFSPRHT